MILAVHTPYRHSPGLLRGVLKMLRNHLPRRSADVAPSADDAVVRALCHDMGSSLACLERALDQLDGGDRAELLDLARAQAADLTSMLRTAGATSGSVGRRTAAARRLRDVIDESAAASGLPREQLTLAVTKDAAEVAVGDARVKRILLNLLENAHRHGDGAPVRLAATRRDGSVAVALSQEGLPAHRVVGHLTTDQPPVDLTGLGLWSVQRQAGELGGSVAWSDADGWLTLTVLLPDR